MKLDPAPEKVAEPRSIQISIRKWNSKEARFLWSLTASRESLQSGRWKDKEIQTKVFDPVAATYSFFEDNDHLRERYFNLLLDLKQLFSQLIEDKTLLSVFFLDMDLEKFCMFFERSNSRGTELNFIDIITAKIYKDFNLDKNIKLFKDNHKGILFDNAIVEAFVRYISFLKVGQVDRKSILNKLDGNDFNEHWNEICNMYVKASNHLVSQRLIMSTDWIPYKTMFIPNSRRLQNDGRYSSQSSPVPNDYPQI